MPDKNFNLTPAKRALLEALLKEKALSIPKWRAITPRGTGEPAPLSFAQQRMWFLDFLERDAYVYNVPSAYQILGSLDIQALEDSINDVVRRHEILRTTFVEIDREARQVVAPELKIIINQVDWRALPEAKSETEARRTLVEWAQEPFDLAHGPLLRLHLLQLAEQEYILLFNVHHIIIDEWSTDLLFHELQQLYSAKLAGRSLDLPELPVQYADYAVWQAEWLQTGVVDTQLGYWKEKLAGAPQIIEIKPDFPRPALLSYHGARQIQLFSGRLLDGLRALSKAERVTLFTTLLTAFQVLIYRYTGRVDMLLGTPIANRRQIELENLIGFFLNMLVIRCDLSGAPTFRQLLKRVEMTVLEAFDNQDLPFEKLVEELNPQRDRSRHPLFQISFVLNSATTRKFQLTGLQTSRLALDYGVSKFDLTMFLVERPEGLNARLEYSTDLYKPATIERILNHYRVLLEEIVANPDLPVDRLSLLDEVELDQVLFKWNLTRVDYPSGKCVHQLFEEQVQCTPDVEAVISEGHSLSYRELDARANQLAHYLQGLGVETEVSVGICLDSSPELIVAILGTLKAGGAYVPLDPNYPEKRIAYMLADARAPVLLTKQSLLAKVGDTRVRLVCLDADWPAIARESSEKPGGTVTAGNLAYVMYTSGSTGMPKGVMIPHRGIVRLVKHTNYVQIEPGDRIGQISNIAFDATTFEVWGALLNGASLVMLPQEIVLSPTEFAHTLRREKIQVLFITTALFNQIASIEPAAFQSVRDLLTGGEIASPLRMRQVLSAGGPQRLLNMYGPTENTTFTTWHHVVEVEEATRSIPIGRPVANTQTYILDRCLNLLPVGIPGELYIGGDGLALGYLERPEYTAERFVPNPFGQPGQRLYRTGDLAHYQPDGSIEFLERIDQQVKLRGFRVELGEIESALIEYPTVQQAVVMLRESPSGEKFLAAYLVGRSEQTASSEELRAFLRTRLPDFMLPSAFVFMTALPLTSSGKVDRRALASSADLSAGRLQTGPGYVPPRDEIEQLFCEIWGSVLGLEQVGIEDDFFELGGHSLLAIRLFNYIERELGYRLPLSTLFEAPTVARMVQYLRGTGSGTGWSPIVVIQEQGSQPPFFCVHNFGGEVINLNDLAQALGADQPFIGLQAQGLDGQFEPHTTLPEMATSYVQAIRSYQPEGPYYLGGFCFGGVVAYEMACQLQAQGEHAALVALFDAYAPARAHHGRLVGWLQRTVTFFKNLPLWWRDFLELDKEERRVVVKRRFTRIRKSILRLLGRQVQMTPRELIGDHAHVEEAPAHVQRLMELHLLALQKYTPPEYAGHVTLFHTQKMPLFTYVSPDAGWDNLVQGGVEIVFIPGPHQNILRPPHVHALAKKLGQSLQQARSRCDEL